MPDQFHLLLRTPQPSLSQGMQYRASGYANWFAKRHRCAGHLLQGWFKGQVVEGYNRCAPSNDWIRQEAHVRYRPHVTPPVRPAQALLHRQTVNAQKNLKKKFKSNQDRVIRSDTVHQTA